MSIETAIKDIRVGHSEYQMAWFVLAANSDCNLWGLYQQCGREFVSRRDSLESAEIEIEQSTIDLESQEDAVNAAPAHSKEERAAKVELRKRRLQLERSKKNFENVKREHDFFMEMFDLLASKMSVLSDEEKKILEEDYWCDRFRRMAAIDILCTGKVSKATMLAILSMRPDHRQLLIHELKVTEQEESTLTIKSGSRVRSDCNLIRWLENVDPATAFVHGPICLESEDVRSSPKRSGSISSDETDYRGIG